MRLGKSRSAASTLLYQDGTEQRDTLGSVCHDGPCVSLGIRLRVYEHAEGVHHAESERLISDGLCSWNCVRRLVISAGKCSGAVFIGLLSLHNAGLRPSLGEPLLSAEVRGGGL